MTAINKVLLIGDDMDNAKLNQNYLTAKGYKVQTADCGAATMKALCETDFDCLVLDVHLPDVSGLDLCGIIRKISATPIIFLSCRDNEDDKVKGLLAGGDDYMTKPFSMRELEARIGAHIRRAGAIMLDNTNKIIFCKQKSVILSQTEFDVFQLLYDNLNKAMPPYKIYAVLKDGERDDSNTIAVYIRRLRKKLAIFSEDFGIETIRGKGYGLFER